jgi:methanethiol S-methyltransferase
MDDDTLFTTGDLMKRAAFLLYGLGAYAVFFVTFLYAIGFVEGAFVPRAIDAGGPAAGLGTAVLVNVLLLSLFAVQHSVMARRGFKEVWTRVVPKAIERSTYVLLASLCLDALFWYWHPIPLVIWQLEAPLLRGLVVGVSLLGWGIVLVSTFLINHFDLFGLRQVFYAARGAPVPPHQFRTPMLYRLVRHPIYMGFIIAFWFTPTMTVGHMLFAAVTLAYIVVAVQFEERDLVREYGERYKAYRRQVRGLVPLPRSATSSSPTETA